MGDEQDLKQSTSPVLQAGEGYACICGWKGLEKDELGKHFLISARRDGKGVHKSVGRMNLQTGEVTHPPYNQRTAKEKAETTFKTTSLKPKSKELKETSTSPRLTDSWEQATEFRVIPRVFQMDFTPTMRLAKVASTQEWGWKDMPWADFFDTCLHTFFKEHGIILAGYIVQELEKEEEVAA